MPTPLLTFPRSFEDRRTLTASDRRVAHAIAEAMFSQDGEVDARRIDAVIADVDAYVSAASRPIRFGLRVALFIVRIAPLLLFHRLAFIETLDVEARVALLSRLERSRLAFLSLAFIGWRTVMTFVFYEDAAELRRLGYAGEERLRYKRRLEVVRAPAMTAPATAVPAAAYATAPAAPPVPAMAAIASSAPVSFPALSSTAPPAEESGVRLRSTPDDSTETTAIESDDASREVA